MAAYPKELRERLVAAAEQGEYTIAEIANTFSVGVTFVKKMLKLHREGEDLAPHYAGGPVRLLGDKELALLRNEIKEHADATLEELQKMLADKAQVTASLPTICRALQNLNLPRKKSLAANECDENERRIFKKMTKGCDTRKYIFIDEMGSNIAMTMLYGRAEAGERVIDKLSKDQYSHDRQEPVLSAQCCQI